jgi:DNA repair protein SbcC/Rad50
VITKLELEGFQAYKNSVITFEKGINIIIGDSNAGKSSIARAINFVVNNISNENIINYDCEEVKVKLHIENNTIEKVKSKKDNYYVINNDSDNKLDKVGQTVPEIVKELTNFTDINIQTQFEKFFLLQDSAGDVMKKLNQYINLSLVDESIKKIKNKVNEKNREILFEEREVEKLKIEVKKYNNLEEFESKLLEVENKESELDKLKIDNDVILNLLHEFYLLDKELFKYKDIEENKILVKKLKEKIKEYNDLKDVFNILFSLSNDLQMINKSSNDFYYLIENLKEEKNNLLPDDFICPFNKICKIKDLK